MNPTSAVNWAPSSVHSITWNSGTTSGNVNIKYYNGVSYNSIATGIVDSGSYDWFVPTILSGSYWIYIEDAANSNINGTSASFTIPFITVTNPTSAVNWAPSSVHSITWNSGTTSGYVNIKYYDGVSYTSIATDMADSGSYNWVIPAISSGSYWIYIEDAANPNINGTSASFTIPFITVINPTSAVNWAPSSLQSITWNSGTTSGNVNIKYYNGITYTTIAAGISDSGSYNWFVPAISSGTLYNFYRNAANSNINGTSASFTIPSITITNPTGSVTWATSSLQDITWTSIGTSGGVTIELFSSGVYSSTIVSWTIDSGSYDWFVPVLSSGTCQIFIKDAANSNINGTSASFTIPFITVINPTSGVVWAPSSLHDITWISSGY